MERSTLCVSIVLAGLFVFIIYGAKNHDILFHIHNINIRPPHKPHGCPTIDNTPNTPKSKREVLILQWDFVPGAHWRLGSNEKALPCDATTVRDSSCTCKYTNDKSRLNASTAVMGDVRVYRRKNYTPSQIRKLQRPGQYWILYNIESLGFPDNDHPILTPGLFNLSATFQKEADIHLPYGYCVPRNNKPPFNVDSINIEDKENASLWYVSHCLSNSFRMEYAQKLRKYTQIEMRGKCNHKIDNTTATQRRYVPGTFKVQSHLDEISQYKYYLSFENSYCRDYITEKVYKILQDNVFTVPIVRGLGPYNHTLPHHSYINAADFPTPKHLAQYLSKLNKNSTQYMEYFKWREKFKCEDFYSSRYEWPCRLCQKVCDLRDKKQIKILNNMDIFKNEAVCLKPKHMLDNPR